MFTIARGRGALSCLATLCIVFSVVCGADASGEGAPGVLPPSSGQALTAPWQEQDIGTLDVPGGSSDSFGTLTITSAGDIGGAADRFHYVYQPLIGDGEIVARVAALVARDPWSQAGVMIRESLSPSAQEMFVGATGGNGWVVQRRDGTTSGWTETSYGPSGLAPGWVRLVREGDRISGYVSADGATWTLVRAQTLSLPGTVYVGMAVASHSSSLSAGVFMNVSVGQPAPSATVAITSPSGGSTFTAPAAIPIAATVTTTNTSVSRVDFYGDGVMVGSDLSAPYSFTWSSVAAGAHTVSATAILNTGGSVSAQPVSVSVSAPAPAGSGGSGPGGTWQEQDVGTMAAPGGSSDSFGTITITSAGDIGGAADSFHFVYQPLSGDGEIVAGVAALVARDPWSVAGVMIRESLTPSSQEMFVGASGGNGWVVQRRDGTTSGLTETSYGPSGTAPGWVRLVREGDRISGYVSADGATWTLVRAQTIPLPVTAYVGMAVASHSAAATAGVFMNVTLQTSTTGTPGSGGDPVPSASVTITSPSAGATYTAPATIAITAAVTTSNTSVSRVDIYGDGQLIGSDASAPYSVTWSSVSSGTHTLSAMAILTTGGSAIAQPVSVSVGVPSPTASVTITSPSAGATYTAPAAIPITAGVTTSNTSVSRVDFYGDGSLIGSDASAPYSVTWSNVAAGTHTLSATALLTTGGSVNAQSVSVSVSDGGGSGSPSGPLTDWHDQDIGTVSVPGGSSNNLGTITITSAGDIGGAADQFHFVYQPLPGDGEIVARVGALVAKDGWSQAGVMIREALTPSAFEMFVGATGGNGWVVQRRDGTTSGLTETTYGPAGAAPGWVRLVRAGDLISAYVSSDGATWTLIKAQTIALPATAYVGLAAASHTTSLAAGVFMNVMLQASTGTPGSGGQPVPTASISITSPGAGATFTAPATIAISAAVTTSNTSVSRVDFYGDGVLLGSDASAPYTFTWSSVTAGTHAVSAAAVLTTGGSVSAQPVSISVGVPGTTSSTLIFTPPADESTTVTSYTFEVYLQGGAMPIASRNVGKPPTANGEISVDVGDLIDALPHGTYTAVVTAVGPGGSTASQPSPAFTK